MSRDFRVNVGPYAFVNKIPQEVKVTARKCSMPTCWSRRELFAVHYQSRNFCGHCGAPIQETATQVVRWPAPDVDDEWSLLAEAEDGFHFVPNHQGPRTFVFAEDDHEPCAIESADIARDLEWFADHYEATIRILREKGHTVRLGWGVVGGFL